MVQASLLQLLETCSPKGPTWAAAPQNPADPPGLLISPVDAVSCKVGFQVPISRLHRAFKLQVSPNVGVNFCSPSFPGLGFLQTERDSGPQLWAEQSVSWWLAVREACSPVRHLSPHLLRKEPRGVPAAAPRSFVICGDSGSHKGWASSPTHPRPPTALPCHGGRGQAKMDPKELSL